MNKAIILFAVIVIAFVCVEANKPKCRPLCRKNQHSPVRCVRDSKTSCRKIRQCSIDEENCRRRLSKRPHITSTSLALCKNIKGHVGSGPCAGKKPIRKPRSACHQLKCDNPSKVRNCYRSKHKHCRLLTACETKRLNCQRGSSNAVKKVDSRQCAGIKPGQKQRCRKVKKSG